MAERAEETQIHVDSVLESVVVHSSGAVCTRRARCALPVVPGAAGGRPVRLRLDGLPVVLYEHSLRGRIVSGPPGLRVTDVRLDVGATLRRPDDLPGLRLDLEDAQDRLTVARERRDRLTAEVTEVAAFRAVPPQPKRGDPPRWAPVESILALAGFVDSRLRVLQQRLRAAEEEVRRAEHDAEVLASRLEESSSALHSDRTRDTAAAVLTLDRAGAAPASSDTAPDAESGADARMDAPTGVDRDPARGTGTAPLAGRASVEIELEYHVPGATWSPVYQLRLERAPRVAAAADAGAPGEPSRGVEGTLVLRGCVAQRTGEDWSGVRLGLSTADLHRRADLPELRSLRIGRRQEPPASHGGWREPPAGLGELFVRYDAAVAARAGAARPQPVAAAGGSGLFTAVPLPAPAVPAPPPFVVGSAPAAQPQQSVAPGPVPGGSADLAGSAEGFGYGGGPLTPPPAPGAAAAPPPAAASRSQAARMRRASSAPVPRRGPVVEEALPAPQGPSRELLDYARLTLAGPQEGGTRGTLQPAPSGADALVREYRQRADVVSRLERPAHAVDVRHAAGSFDYRFDTAAPVDVEADGSWHTVPVCEIPVDTAMEYACVPAVDEAVYGTVLLTNASGHALLAGPADVTVEGEFVLTAPLPTLAPGERRRVGVGVIESVQVARRTRMHESTAGLRGGTTVLDHQVEVEVANRLPHRVVVEVRERVPVTDDRDVRIEERQAAPPWRADDEPHDGQLVRGARLWRVELDAGQTVTLTGGYEIRVPAGKALVGGNRRD